MYTSGRSSFRDKIFKREVTLNESKKTKKYYPFDFELKIEVFLKINCLEFEITIFNKTNNAMPINFGLHPYFNVSDFKNLEFFDNPLNCQDTIRNTLDELNKINLGVDLLMYTSGRSSFRDKIFKREVTLNPVSYTHLTLPTK